MGFDHINYGSTILATFCGQRLRCTRISPSKGGENQSESKIIALSKF